jgi:hypothetical protein
MRKLRSCQFNYEEHKFWEMYVVVNLPFGFIVLQTLCKLKIIYLRLLDGCKCHNLSLVCTNMSILYFFCQFSSNYIVPHSLFILSWTFL